MSAPEPPGWDIGGSGLLFFLPPTILSDLPFLPAIVRPPPHRLPSFSAPRPVIRTRVRKLLPFFRALNAQCPQLPGLGAGQLIRINQSG
jgi:hypothetical protein